MPVYNQAGVWPDTWWRRRQRRWRRQQQRQQRQRQHQR